MLESCMVGRSSLSLLVAVFSLGLVYGKEPVWLKSTDLKESSGLAVSHHDSDLIWTHNDSGSKPRLYQFDRSSGDLRGLFELTEIKAVDWEDMCSFELAGKRYLAVGDIGDNHRRRKTVSIHVIEEPLPLPAPLVPGAGSQKSTTILPVRNRLTFEVTYPDGGVDCEGLAYDAAGSRFVLLTKELFRCRVLVVPLDISHFKMLHANPEPETIKCKAEYVQTLGIPLVTAADLSPDGRQLLVCTYGPAYLLEREKNGWSERTMVRIKLPNRRQGEAIAFAGPDQLLVTSEFAPTPLWTVDIAQD